jgi:hypothetical protein
MSMKWEIDKRTERAAREYPPKDFDKFDRPATQFMGFQTSTQAWNRRVVQPATWKAGPLRSGPREIIRQFRDRRYTQALALVVSWGGMARTSKYIYGDGTPETIGHIEQTLLNCAESIKTSRSIEDSWKALTGGKGGQLGWSAVMTSKALHFLCRSLDFEQNPPAVIDGKRIRESIWPGFLDSIPFAQRPGDWEGDTFEAYCRYMTAILTWADQMHWTTTQMENALTNLADGAGGPGSGRRWRLTVPHLCRS